MPIRTIRGSAPEQDQGKLVRLVEIMLDKSNKTYSQLKRSTSWAEVLITSVFHCFSRGCYSFWSGSVMTSVKEVKSLRCDYILLDFSSIISTNLINNSTVMHIFTEWVRCLYNIDFKITGQNRWQNCPYLNLAYLYDQMSDCNLI